MGYYVIMVTQLVFGRTVFSLCYCSISSGNKWSHDVSNLSQQLPTHVEHLVASWS